MNATSFKICSLLVGMVLGFLCSGQFCLGQPPVPPIQEQSPTPGIWVFRSDHFELNTDLSPREAVKLLDQLEQLVSNLNAYWDQPLEGRIKCFVVVDLDRWPKNSLDPDGRAKIAEKSGTTITLRQSLNGEVESIQSVVYAVADGRTPLHETVHAFCWQTFGRCGPDWFSEGMAEVGAYWRSNQPPQAPKWIVDYLQTDPSVTPRDIVNDKLSGRKPWQVYAHRWAFCQLLVSNPRYCARFRQFGRDLLTGQEPDFAKRFPELKGTLATDYRTFVAQLGAAYHTARKTSSN